MPEKDVAASIKEKNPAVLWKPISDKFGVGTPDRCAIIRDSSVVFWVELKYLAKLPKNACKVGLKPKQAGWLAEWRKFGGNSYLIIGIGDLKKVAIFYGDFMKISHEGLKREDFVLVSYDEITSKIKNDVNCFEGK